MLSDTIRENMKLYAQAHCFRKTTQWNMRNAWHRPLTFSEDQIERAHALQDYCDITTTNGFLLNRFLYTIHEQSAVFLPHMKINDICRKDYDAYFDRICLGLGLATRIPLEQAIFGFLDDGIDTREWRVDGLLDYLRAEVEREDLAPLALADTLRRVRHKEEALRIFLLHKASDFLTEGSAMAGSLAGSYGPLQCALMRIFADEYGNGRLESKHSSLFKESMASCGLETYPHCYLDEYLPTSLMMANYFHFLCKSPKHFFKYLGAMYYAESTTTCFFQKLVAAFHEALGDTPLNLRYFQEHIEVDQCHRTIVLEDLILPAINTYGETIIQDVYEGFEGFRRLAGFAASDMQQQMLFADDVLGRDCSASPSSSSAAKLRLFAAQRSFFPQVADSPIRLVVESGMLEFGVGIGEPVILERGITIAIPQGRLFRLRATEGEDCALSLHEQT